MGRGVASINWGAVPPGIFDAAEDTVNWSVEAAGPGAVAVVRAAVIGPEPATDVAVRVRSGGITGAGALDAAGRATVPLVDAQRGDLTESGAWNHDWQTTSVVNRGTDAGGERTTGGPGQDPHLGADASGPATAGRLPGRNPGERVFLLRVGPASLC
ncbi:MAG: hypothetical protein K2X97_08530 [Mycobacteriaceae bacterium]|nr:hypothetical protein [Mycobacteriaceae bacterium]